MNKVLRLFLKGGVPLDLILPEKEAERRLERWKHRQIDNSDIEGVTVDGVTWVCNLKEVAAAVIVPLPQQSVVQGPARNPWDRSGH